MKPHSRVISLPSENVDTEAASAVVGAVADPRCF